MGSTVNIGLEENVQAWLITAHFALSALMFGVVWFVQCVHYPLMRRVAPERFAAFMEEHIRRMALGIGPLMALELLSAGLLALGSASGAARWNLGLLLGAWAVTLAVQAPIYRQLTEGHSPALVDRLIRTNWLRTALWGGHVVLAFMLCWGAGRA